MGGEPFFVVTQPVHEGLIAALKQQVIPQLLADAPPLEEAKLADPQQMRFTVIFDREGYSPKLFAELKAQRIAIVTYHKFPGELWPEAEFQPHTLRLLNGPEVERSLAERGTCLSNGLWVKEVRARSEDGTQSSILSTNMRLDLKQIAVWMPGRWCQENYLRYMRQHFGLDRLIEHGSLPLPETTLVVNPEYRRGSQELRRQRSKLHQLQAQLGAHTLPPHATPQQIQEFETTGGELQAKVQDQEAQILLRKEKQKGLARKVQLKTLPEDQRFRQLCPESKHFIDTIKMIAYRAESALAATLGESLQRADDVRSLLRRAFVTPANLRPDYQNQTLTVELHRLGSPLQDAALANLCAELTDTETQFPTTNLKLIYRQVGSA